ncbi:hypothetical protein [Leptolyngbya sp. NK1-12]|uniref:hypothetical protein n=1 Tax=Leptolyngbya sp. NK1-12 TaxID=2547451 RepID=UPI00293002D0|nr:hypothetical protein [Leptolyngbya sp. NK1-12]
MTRSSLDRLSIYADLGVPEIWRYDGRALFIYSLREGQYEVHERSIALPLIQAKDLVSFLELCSTIGENGLIKQFRQWIRSQSTNL